MLTDSLSAMTTMAARIRARRNALKLTQQQVADQLGISRVSVTQWELGVTQPDIDRIGKLAELLGCSVEWLMLGVELNNPAKAEAVILDETHRIYTMPAAPNARVAGPVKGAPATVPVYGQAVGGLDGEFHMNGNILYHTMAPPQISEINGAYAVLVSGDSMEPRYFDGETCFVDPSRRPRRGDFVVAQVQTEEEGTRLAFVKRFVRHNAQELVLEQFNPPKELRFAAENVVSVHYIAMAGAT